MEAVMDKDKCVPSGDTTNAPLSRTILAEKQNRNEKTE
jgi:hypothetical protein